MLGDLRAVAGEEDIPPAARKALMDMKDFLPYRSYRLLDAAWILCCSSSRAITRLRGPDEHEYEIEIDRAPRIRIALRFGSSCVTSRSPRPAARPASQRLARSATRGAAFWSNEVAVAKERLEAARAKLAPQHPDIARLESELRAATQRVAEAKAAQAGEYVRQVEGEKRAGAEGLALPKFGDRSIMNTSFTMDLGETVVVGTSRLSGNSKALIALLTAGTSEVGAVATLRQPQVSRAQVSGSVAVWRLTRIDRRRYNQMRCSKNAAATRQILEQLSEQHPGADTELHFSNAYELLVATILSAQCTDERVNQVTPALFRRYPDARALARASTSELEPQIQSTGFFRAKSRSLKGMATALVDEHGGEVPRTMEALVKLPGVGRKTANVVLGHALGVPGLPVDRHVLRVANRIGIARSDDPVVVEQQLCAALPPADWTRASDTLILHGRRICKPRPLCDRCAVTEDCEYFRHVVSKERDERQGRAKAARYTVGGRRRPDAKSPLQAPRAPQTTPSGERREVQVAARESGDK